MAAITSNNTSPEIASEYDREKQVPITETANGADYDDTSKHSSEDSSTHKQDGVKRVEAITTVFTRKTMWTMFVLLYLVSFVDMLIVSVQGNLNAYVTSDFALHGLLSITGIVSSIIGGVAGFTIAKIIDIFGRVEGFLVMLLITVLGMIMKAVCQNVQTYAAAHTFYWVGHLGLLYVIDIILADMTTLKNRMLIITLNGTPNIATTFAGPEIAELFYTHSTWRWAFGAFLIILVGVAFPVAIILLLNQRKAMKLGVIAPKKSERTVFQSIKYYVIEFDVVGIILTTATFSLILLPFSLAASSRNKWASADIIAMIVVGVASGIAFVVWERYFAPVQFFPFRYLKERTIIGACLLYGFMFISIFTWDAYYYSYLQVVHRQSIAHAGYILNTFSLTSAFISPGVGYLISRTGDFKYTSYAGIPFTVLGTALLIHFRTPETHVGYLVMCQVFNGIGSGIFATCGQLAVMASVTHQEIAVSLALWGMFGSVGAAIGNAIAGALWTNVIPAQLAARLPEGKKELAASIYASIVTQMSYEDGTEERDAIVGAYGDVQRKMVIAGSAFIPVLFLAVALFKNINVKKLEREKGTQTKGTIW